MLIRFAKVLVGAASFVALTATHGFGQATSAAAPTAPPARPIVAVVPFASAGASEPEVSAGTDRLHEELQRIGVFTVADQGAVNAAYQDQKSQPGACASIECAIGIGWALHSQRVVTGKITKMDDTHWLVSAQLLDVETSKSLRTSSLQYAGSFFDFVREGIPFLASRMSGTAPKESRALALRLTETLNLSGEPAPGETATASPRVSEASGGARRKGFGAFTGYSFSSGTVHLLSGRSLTYAGGGVPSLGVDYQTEINPQWTLLPYFALGDGGVTGDMADYYDAVGAEEIGVEVRYWRDRLYIGGRAALYAVAFVAVNSSPKNDTFALSGESLGISGGYEADTGAFVNGAVDYGAFTANKSISARKVATTMPIKLEGSGEGYTLWVNIGYRWK